MKVVTINAYLFSLFTFDFSLLTFDFQLKEKATDKSMAVFVFGELKKGDYYM